MSFEHDKRFCVYPCYINANRRVSEGRKISKDNACDDPTTPEIFDCIVNGLKLPAEVERKCHPRDFGVLGRVRVQLLNDDGKPINPSIPTKRILLVKVAELVPRHPGRSGKPKAQASTAGPSGTGGASGSNSKPASGGGGSKKSGKKKK